ncbi:OpgC family protein [Xanthobacter sp. TB0139]|uniref:OpgC family protein n=1 Tax=Xanthobacter sp. TB0139 TaxID=3459178 RepID=UPI00403A2176
MHPNAHSPALHPPRQAGRLVSVDFWRGFALLTIFINHVPGLFLGHYTFRNFGVSDAAELFVLLAGVSAAFAYLRKYGPGSRLGVAIRVWLRAFNLYAAHLALVLVAIATIGGFAIWSGDFRILNQYHLDLLLNTPLEGLVGIVLLTFQPAYLNILPLYVGVLLMAPALIALMRRSIALGLGVSFAFYVVAQLAGLALPVWPNNGRWFFNPFTWQFLFACGLAIGAAIDSGRMLVANRLLDILAPLYLLACLGWVWAGFPYALELWPLPTFALGFDKTNLDLPRLLHILALVYCVSRLPLENLFRQSRMARPLIVMGRHSLPVFCVGTILSLGAQAMRPVFEGALSFDLFIIGAGFFIQWLVAWTLEWQRGHALAPQIAAASRPVGQNITRQEPLAS